MRWLKSLPKPVGILACDDEFGQRVLDACLRAEGELPIETIAGRVGFCSPAHFSAAFRGRTGKRRNPKGSGVFEKPKGVRRL